jgi:hypothetical protein
MQHTEYVIKGAAQFFVLALQISDDLNYKKLLFYQWHTRPNNDPFIRNHRHHCRTPNEEDLSHIGRGVHLRAFLGFFGGRRGLDFNNEEHSTRTVG